MRQKRSRGHIGYLLSAVLFLTVLIVLALGTTRLAGGADAEGVRVMRDAIERAAVVCYATQGFYPPTLGYIEENYGVQIDHERYIVHYEVFAANIMPNVLVLAR